MILVTESLGKPAFWSFPGRPARRERRSDTDTPHWRNHPLAPAVDALLVERGLDEWDIELFVDRHILYAITGCWPYELVAGQGDTDGTDVAAVLSPDLDHLVAWRRRDAMIAATIGTLDEGGPWVAPATREAPGHVGAAPGAEFADAVPLWAVTASTALLGHLARIGVTPLEALRLACARPCNPDNSYTWPDLDGVYIHYEYGRLHGREFIGKYTIDGGRIHTVDDFYGMTVNLADRTLPAAVRAGAIGRRLGELGTFPTQPALLAGLDPVMTEVDEVGSLLTKAMAAGLLVGLEVDTETLADVPAAALAALGDMRQRVPRSEKPWLGSGTIDLRARPKIEFSDFQ